MRFRDACRSTVVVWSLSELGLTFRPWIATVRDMTTQSDQRKAASLTQDQAARQAGVSVATWRRWERDPASVTPDVATQCQAALQGDTVDELLWDGVDKMLTAFGPDAPTDRGSRLTRALKSINDLLETSQELMAANMRPTDALRLRWGMAVMQATASMALINPESTYEDAATAIQGLFPKAARS